MGAVFAEILTGKKIFDNLENGKQVKGLSLSLIAARFPEDFRRWSR